MDEQEDPLRVVAALTRRLVDGALPFMSAWELDPYCEHPVDGEEMWEQLNAALVAAGFPSRNQPPSEHSDSGT